MFEGNVPPNLPIDEKVEDIFAPVEPVKSVPPEGGALPTPAPKETPRMGFKRILILGSGIVVLGFIVWGAYAGFRSWQEKRVTESREVPPALQSPEASSLQEPQEISPQPREDSGQPPLQDTGVSAPEPVDSDGDGLSDDEEIALGMNAQNADTDSDGLTDREEVRVYQSDPLNPDTDGDTYPDGHEVKNNYSPTGPGRLLPSVPGQQ